jgi:hypothetical protein
MGADTITCLNDKQKSRMLRLFEGMKVGKPYDGGLGINVALRLSDKG